MLVGGILGGVFGYFSLAITDDRGSYGGFVVVYAMILYGIVFAVIGGAKPKEMKSFMFPIIIMIFTVFIFYNFFYDDIYLTVIYLMIVATIILYKIKKIVKYMSSIIVVILITILPLYFIFHSHMKDFPNIKKMYFKIEGEKELLQKVHINIQYISYDVPVIYTVFHNGMKFKDDFYAHQYGFYINYDNHLYAKFIEDKNSDSYLNNNTLNFLKKDSDIYLNCKKNVLS